ncbi:MAG: hypothetical protein CMK09_11130 [Ponticaulis sp.]|nr:hypothetical protein [Ponticaulis sp.]|tara:strand:- start:62855 stop:63376 length:522 start_codon:yes stop_codon:yes gene_type:complete
MPETTHLAFLRAVNVGGTGKLKMDELKAMCRELGFRNPRTYIASGNLAFESEQSSNEVRTALEARLEAHAGKPVGLIMRSRDEVDALIKANPFSDAPGNKVIVLLLNSLVTDLHTKDVKHHSNEQFKAGQREIFIYYPEGQGQSKLSFKLAQAEGTARNMNTMLKMKQLALNA